MAGPKVTLEFAGDHSDLTRALQSVTSELGSLSKRIDSEASTIVEANDEIGKSARNMRDVVGKASGVAALGVAGIGGAAAGSALIAGGALAGLGLAVGGLGVLVASKNEAVKKSFSSLADHVKAKVTEMSAPFVPVLQGIAEKARSTFDRIAPSLSNMFANAAPYVDKLATGLLKLVENVMPGLEKGVKAAAGPIDSISRGLAGTGEALGKFFENISVGASGGASALDMLFSVVNWLIPAIGSLIGFLAQWSGVIVPLAIAVGGFALLVKGITASMAAYNAIMTVVRAATVVWTGVQWLLNAALTANPIGLVILAIAALVAGIIWAWNNCETFRNIVIGVFNAVKNAISTAIDWIVGRFNWLVGAFQSVAGAVGRVFSGIGDGIKSAFRSAFNFVADIWNNTVGRLSFTVPSWVPGIGGNNFSAPRIPKFHTGGIVPGAPGSEQLALLQAGERVTSRNKVNQEEGGALILGSDGSKLGDVMLALIEEAARKQGRRIQRA
ncbi:hypothetical protein [Saccharothrix sp. NRRL B-16348]|uniref:hypothetical protein n=1 Tax=Saccharothrix sp. NRRL B-16348 TaxID=1415542 RepID=UPI000A3E14C0|nr:hypothetical protein [Saccharothrix sp. NRRL B-16348]